jgi:hypothetical protein
MNSYVHGGMRIYIDTATSTNGYRRTDSQKSSLSQDGMKSKAYTKTFNGLRIALDKPTMRR